MALDSRKSDDDHTCTIDNIDVAIDRISYPYLEGATVDYVEDQEEENLAFKYQILMQIYWHFLAEPDVAHAPVELAVVN